MILKLYSALVLKNLYR
jgi:hypothetical protein